MAKVLITGVAGFIGMHTAIRFLKEGWDVTGLDNMNNYYSVQLKEDRLTEIGKFSDSLNREFVFYRDDLNSNVWAKFDNIHFDAVIHLAAQAGVRYSIENPKAYLESNILGFQSVLDFVALKKIDKFIYASSSSVYGKDSKQPFKETESCNSPESYYAATKKANELMAITYKKVFNINSIGLRFFTVYGPWGRPDMAPFIFTKSAFEVNPIKIFNFGKQKRDFTYISDIVNGIFKIIDLNSFPKEALICNIGNGAPVELLDFIGCIEHFTNRELKKEYVVAQKGDVESTFADTNLLYKLTGFKPKVSLNEGVLNLVKWYVKYHNIK